MLKIVIPGKPVPQERPFVTRYGTFDRKRSKQAKKVIAQHAQVALAAHRIGLLGPSFTGDVSLTIHFYGARSNADIDNLYKNVSDAMEGVVYANDRQVQRMFCFKLPAEPGQERTEIEVMEL